MSAKPRFFRAEVVDDRLELMSLDGPLVVVPVQQAIAAPELFDSLSETAATLELLASRGDVTAQDVTEVLERASAVLRKTEVDS